MTSDFIFFLTTGILGVLIFEFYRLYKLKMLLHPGFYFALLWVFAVPSQWYLIKVDYAQLPFPEFVDELNLFVAFTGLVFLVVIRIGRSTISDEIIVLRFSNSFRLYRIMLYVTLLSTLLKFIILILTSGFSLNLAQNRDLLVSSNFQNRGLNILDFVFSYGSMFFPLLAILAGYYLGLKMQKIISPVSSIYLISLPFFISIVQVLLIGGRNPLASGIKYYVIGFALTLGLKLKNKYKRKILFSLISLALVFNVFSTWVGNQRDVYLKEDVVINIDNPILNQFSGVMTYMSSHYWGYQLRRDDSFDAFDLGYGSNTFAGIFDFQIPFSGFIGVKTDLRSLFNVENKLDYFYLKEHHFAGYYTTNSIYLQAICDFGEKGIYLFLLVLVLFSHYMFLKIHNWKFYKATDLYFFILIFIFWSSSNFESVFSSKAIFVFFLVLLSHNFLNRNKLNLTKNSIK